MTARAFLSENPPQPMSMREKMRRIAFLLECKEGVAMLGCVMALAIAETGWNGHRVPIIKRDLKRADACVW